MTIPGGHVLSSFYLNLVLFSKNGINLYSLNRSIWNLQLSAFSWILLYIFLLYICYLCVYMCRHAYPKVHTEIRTTCRAEFSPFTVWVPGIKLMSVLTAGFFTCCAVLPAHVVYFWTVECRIVRSVSSTPWLPSLLYQAVLQPGAKGKFSRNH